MSNGVLCFANNNEINYIKQAEQLAIRIKKYMGLPTSLCTSDQYSNSGKIFDKIIKLKEGLLTIKDITIQLTLKL